MEGGVSGVSRRCYDEAFEPTMHAGLLVPVGSERSGSIGVVVPLLVFLFVVKRLSRIICIIIYIIPEGTRRAR